MSGWSGLAVSPQCGFSSSDKANTIMSEDQAVGEARPRGRTGRARLGRLIAAAGGRVWPAGLGELAMPNRSRSAGGTARHRLGAASGRGPDCGDDGRASLCAADQPLDHLPHSGDCGGLALGRGSCRDCGLCRHPVGGVFLLPAALQLQDSGDPAAHQSRRCSW